MNVRIYWDKQNEGLKEKKKIFNNFMDLVVEYKEVIVVEDLEISTRTQHSVLSEKESVWSVWGLF